MSNTPTMNGKVGTPMSSGPSEQSKSMHGSTPQQNAVDENAYNKIFVGGLHYDTRDRKLFRCNHNQRIRVTHIYLGLL